MSVASKILKNFSLFVDGNGYAGNVDELKLPALNIKTEEFRAGGMDAPVAIEMGQEKMEATFMLSGYDAAALSQWGVGPKNLVQLVARGALESLDGTVTAVNVTMNGTVRAMEPGQWKAGEKSTMTLIMDLQTYTYTQAGAVIHDIDVLNFKRTVNGVDRLSAQRRAIGL